MDLLLNVQLQLAQIANSLAQPSHAFATSRHPSTAQAPVLIGIERLLDEIRAATRAIVLKNSERERTAMSSTYTTTRPTELRSFRFKLESESETETEDEEKHEREEEQRYSGDGIGAKRSREGEDDEDIQSKSKGTQLETEKAIQLRRSIGKVVQSVTEFSSVGNDTPAPILHQALAGLEQTSAHAISQMRKLTHDGRIPDLKLAQEFSNAMVQLPELIMRHRAKRELNPKWVSATSANLKHIFHHARKHPAWPKCLSAPSFQATWEIIRGFCEMAAPDLLHKMEVLIENVSKGGPLHADRLEQPLGKLASLFLTDVKGYRAKENTTRSEEEWSRFAQIGRVLAEWIHEAQKAQKPPKMRTYLRKFDRQLNSFAAKNPNRVPQLLLEASTILAGFVSQKKVPKLISTEHLQNTS